MKKQFDEKAIKEKMISEMKSWEAQYYKTTPAQGYILTLLEETIPKLAGKETEQQSVKDTTYSIISLIMSLQCQIEEMKSKHETIMALLADTDLSTTQGEQNDTA